jgi:hypothetical protein
MVVYSRASMCRRILNIATALSLALLVATAALWVRSFFVTEHLAYAGMGRAAGDWAMVVRSSQGAIYFDRRSYWDYQRGWTWGRRRISGPNDALRYAYQTPSWSRTLLGIRAFGGTAYTWPGHLYPNVRPLPPLKDPRWWKDRYTALCIPFWALAAIFSAAPLCHGFRAYHQRTKRNRAGRCLKCGYNLTGNVSGVCPECGLAVN